MEKKQREFLLRQQLAAIRKELGDTDTSADAVAGYRASLEARNPPPDVRVAVNREIDRLERMNEQSAEHSWIRNWLDVVLDMPWNARTADRLDVSAARAVLDADTTGLHDAKDRIVEWLAVRKLRAARVAADTLIEPIGRVYSTEDTTTTDPESSDYASSDYASSEYASTEDVAPPVVRRGNGAILLLTGPPGVGKTSLGESIARALGRRFTRVALGGIRDEAEIRGHRRTYVGAQPGRIVRALREAGTMNPVILLDEIDKLSSGWAGDPGSALLEVLDPAQNHTFRDHYLEVDLDLSDVIFIATANSLETISAPMLDRMELITVDGYTDEEKVAIARNHLLERQLRKMGLSEADVVVSDDALRTIVEGYTHEAGVRSFERELAKLLRKVAVGVAERESGEGDRSSEARHPAAQITSDDDVRALLGRPRRFHEDVAARVATPGVATGLAVTGAGGDVLFVEATVMPASGDDTSLTVTGQLGDVMKESASIALSYVRANASRFGIDPSAFAGKKIHIHFPAGAVPKDGPSAGITMTTALVSVLSGRAVKSSVAMTGEVTLQGNVLPIGGIKQKLLAAHRAGIATVIIPRRNEADLDDLPAVIRAALDIHPFADVADVIDLALER